MYWLRAIGGVAVVSFLLTAFTPVSSLLAYWTTPHRPAERAEAIVVMGGGGVSAGAELTDNSLRGVIQAMALYRDGFAPLVVFSGPAAAGEPAEAQIRAALARRCAIPEAAILTATGGRTTREEAVEIGALLQSRGIRRILLVTDGQGMARTVDVFERLGFSVVPDPSAGVLSLEGGPEDRLGLMRHVAIELIAHLYYRVAGYL